MSSLLPCLVHKLDNDIHVGIDRKTDCYMIIHPDSYYIFIITGKEASLLEYDILEGNFLTTRGASTTRRTYKPWKICHVKLNPTFTL